MGDLLSLKALVASLVYSLIGFAVFIGAFFIYDTFTPYHLWNELTKEKNIALAIVVGSVAIGISMIISAAIHG